MDYLRSEEEKGQTKIIASKEDNIIGIIYMDEGLIVLKGRKKIIILNRAGLDEISFTQSKQLK